MAMSVQHIILEPLNVGHLSWRQPRVVHSLIMKMSIFICQPQYFTCDCKYPKNINARNAKEDNWRLSRLSQLTQIIVGGLRA